MDPSERREAPVEDLLREEQERWQRIADAKTPEELERALREPPRPSSEPPAPETPRSRDWRSAIFPVVVLLILALAAMETLTGGKSGEPVATPTHGNEDFGVSVISPLSVGPLVAVPYGSVVAVVPAVGGDPVPVTPVGAGSRQPAWRPDGRALLVSTSDGLVELPVDDEGMPQWMHRRTLGDYRGVSPAYSPDGRRVAYVAVLADIVIGDRRGRRPRLVAELVDGREPHELDWSRQGRLAVAAGGFITVLLPDGTVVGEVRGALPTAAMPAWSPDGRSLAYAQLNPRPGDGVMRVLVTQPGSRTPPGQRIGPRGSTSAYPAWSPDGRSLAYARFVDGTWDIHVYELESRRERRLTRGLGDEIDPAWSPDGRRIAFVGNLLPSPSPR